MTSRQERTSLTSPKTTVEIKSSMNYTKFKFMNYAYFSVALQKLKR